MAFAEFTTLTPEQVFSRLNTSDAGLSQAEASQRAHQSGPNAVQAQTTSLGEFVARQFRSPFIYLLLLAAGLSFVLGENIDGVLIVLFVLINAGLGLYQEFRSEQSLRLLQKFIVSRSTVVRDHQPQSAPSETLVVGDLIALQAGDIVPADARLIAAEELQLNESTLTGESTTVGKDERPLAQPTSEPYQAQNIVFGGTTVAQGAGRAVIIAIGRETVFGGISRLTVETKRRTSFEAGIAGFSRFVMRLILVTLVLVFVANLIIKRGQIDVLELTVFSLALAIGVIPEALPVVTTLAMSRGALRLARERVVVRRLSAIEDLGSVDVLCTDKTGTITRGQMEVSQVLSTDGPACLQAAVAGITPDDLRAPGAKSSFDAAIWERLSAVDRTTVQNLKLLHEFPFDPNRKRTTVAVQSGSAIWLISRGAPEVLMERCTLSPDAKQEIRHQIRTLGQAGLRTLGVARTVLAQAPAEEDLENDQGLTWLGMVALADPLKLSAHQAIADAKGLGVQVKIITGDGPEVAGTIGFQAGLIAQSTDVVLGQDLMAKTEEHQAQAVEQFHVFARVSPQQKFRIIELLRRRHQVAYLGEGINDAPALKESNLSIVVDSASDIARANADVVLLEKNLSVIVEGIRQGRQVFANTIKYIKSTLLSNFGNFYAVAFASLLISYPPILPLQILLINLLSDFPMISVATDTVDAQDVAKPQAYRVREVALIASVLGSISTLFDFMYFGYFSRFDPATLQTSWFIGSILTELLVLYSIRTKLPFYRAARPSGVIVWLTLVAGALTIVLPYTEFGQRAFHFVPPSLPHLGVIIGIAAAYFVASEIVKIMYYHWRAQNRSELAAIAS